MVKQVVSKKYKINYYKLHKKIKPKKHGKEFHKIFNFLMKMIR